MKTSRLPIAFTAAAAIIMVLYKGHVTIVNPDEAMGSLLMIYTVSWLIIAMLQQPLKQSWLALVSSFRLVLSFGKAS